MKNGEKEKAFEKIKSDPEKLALAKKLVTIRRDAPIEIKNIAELEYKKSPPELIPYFQKLGFKSLLTRMGFAPETEPKKIAPQRTKKEPPPQSQTLF